MKLYRLHTDDFDTPHYLYSFSAFMSKQDAIEYANSHGIDTNVYKIHEYDEADIEEPMIIDSNGDTIENALDAVKSLTRMSLPNFLAWVKKDGDKPYGAVICYLRDMTGMPKVSNHNIAVEVLKHFFGENWE